MEAVLICGNFFSNAGRSNRAWKFSTVELLVNVIQSAPSSSSLAAAPVRSSVSGTVWYQAMSSTIAPLSSSNLGSSGLATSARSKRMRRLSMLSYSASKRPGDFTRHVFVRHQIDLQVQFPELRRRRRPHCGDAHAADVAEILKCLEEIIEKRRDAVRAGEDEPIVSVQPAQRLHNSLVFRRRNG